MDKSIRGRRQPTRLPLDDAHDVEACLMHRAFLLAQKRAGRERWYFLPLGEEGQVVRDLHRAGVLVFYYEQTGLHWVDLGSVK